MRLERMNTMATLPLSALPTFAGVAIDTAEITEQQITLHAASTTVHVRCPVCMQVAYRVHSTYIRTLTDLPWSGIPVRLRLRVRRFFCAAATCPRRTFVEQVPRLTQPHAQRTSRVNHLLQILGVAVGGEPGHRLCHYLSMPTSADTLLRRVRQLPPPAVPTPRVLGVDEWAKRKGRTYGTVLVDLEQRHRVDLLPEATPAQFAAWLRAHPGVEIIARDRGHAYTEGAAQGAPHAIQVADRWHLTCNLGEVVQTVLHRHTADLRTAARRVHVSDDAGVAAAMISPPVPPLGFPAGHIYGPAELRQHQFNEVKTLHQHGWSIRRIAQHLHLHRRTVMRYAHAEALPRRILPQATSSVTPYQAYLLDRWTAGCQQGMQLWTELRARGYCGSLSSVYRALKYLRPADGRRRGGPPPPPTPRPVSPRQAMWLLVRPPDRLTPDEAAYRAALCAVCPDAAIMYPLAQHFMTMVCGRKVEELDGWLTAAETCGVRELRRFAKGLRRDYAAVRAALALPWSTGPVEAQVNRVKLVKRMMYGRANFDVLRLRVLHSI
jgi:transposase